MKLPAPSKYPKSIRIGDEDYRIQFVTQIENKDDLGMCDFGSKVILIKRGMTKEETFKTFIHEALHAIECERNLKISHKLVYELEEGIFQLLKDNF